MFCFQCQETSKNTGCTVRGVCGKAPEVAQLQDLLVYLLKGISFWGTRGRGMGVVHKETNLFVAQSLFATITNANFDADRFVELIKEAADSIAIAAANAGKWDWLGEHIDELEIGEAAGEILLAAYRAGARDFALELVDEHGDELELTGLISEVIAKNDTEFLRQVIEHVEEEQANEICIALANAGNIELAADLAESCDEDTVTELIEIATEKGSWDAIDKLNGYLD